MPAKIHLDLEVLRELVEVKKMRQVDAAAAMGVSEDTVRRQCKAHGIQTQRTGPRGGAGHPEWKGGRRLVGRYWYIHAPDHPHTTKQRYVLEHRIVMEAKLGRYLDPKEVVHHKDGNSQNNAPENLEVFQTNGDHLRAELGWSKKHGEAIRLGIAKSRRDKELGGHPQTQTTSHLLE